MVQSKNTVEISVSQTSGMIYVVHYPLQVRITFPYTDHSLQKH